MSAFLEQLISIKDDAKDLGLKLASSEDQIMEAISRLRSKSREFRSPVINSEFNQNHFIEKINDLTKDIEYRDETIRRLQARLNEKEDQERNGQMRRRLSESSAEYTVSWPRLASPPVTFIPPAKLPRAPPTAEPKEDKDLLERFMDDLIGDDSEAVIHSLRVEVADFRRIEAHLERAVDVAYEEIRFWRQQFLSFRQKDPRLISAKLKAIGALIGNRDEIFKTYIFRAWKMKSSSDI